MGSNAQQPATWLGVLLEFLIIATSCIPICLFTAGPPLSYWGFVVGMLGQPLWLIASWSAKQWGIFIVSVWWTAWYAIGTGEYFWLLLP